MRYLSYTLTDSSDACPRADWIQLVTGVKSTLADNPAAVGQPDQPGIDEHWLTGVASTDDADAGTSKRTKRKQQMNAKAAGKKAIAADPATKLRNELEEQRKAVVPKFIRAPTHKVAKARRLDEDSSEDDEDDVITGDETSFLRNQLRELQRLKDRVVNETELIIIAEESARLRRDLAQKDKVIEHMRSEMTLFASVYNCKHEGECIANFTSSLISMPCHIALLSTRAILSHHARVW